jgi:hypothetical protein
MKNDEQELPIEGRHNTGPNGAQPEVIASAA